jgi:hypothetical protein
VNMRKNLRPLGALAMVALIGVISAGCSGASSDAGTGSSGGNTDATTHEKAVRFAKCMRDNGVREFPDPPASGELTIDAIANGSSLDTSSAVFKRAINSCSSSRWTRSAPSAAERQRLRLAFWAFSLRTVS